MVASFCRDVKIYHKPRCKDYNRIVYASAFYILSVLFFISAVQNKSMSFQETLKGIKIVVTFEDSSLYNSYIFLKLLIKI